MRAAFPMAAFAVLAALIFSPSPAQPVPARTGAVIAGNLVTVGGFTTGISYAEIYGGGSSATIQTFLPVPFPVGGSVSSLFVENTNAKDSGGACLIRMVVNGTDSPLVATIPASGAAGVYRDATHSVRVNAGDLWVMKVDVAGSACSPGGISFRIQ